MGESQRQRLSTPATGRSCDAKRVVAEQQQQHQQVQQQQRKVAAGSEENKTASSPADLSVEVLMEEPTIEHEERTLNGEVAFFHLRIFIQERYPFKGRFAGCRELSWRLRRRQSDFTRLDTALRGTDILPPSVVLPKSGFFQRLCPSEEHVRQMAQELLVYIRAVLGLALSAGAVEAAADPAGCPDCLSGCQALTHFLGLEDSEVEASDSDGMPREGPLVGRWRLPNGAVERQAALVYSIDKGVYIWGHLNDSSECRINRVDKRAMLGELAATHAQYRGPQGERRESSSFGGTLSLSNCGSPHLGFESSPTLAASSPTFGRQMTPPTPTEFLLSSPSCLSPRRLDEDETSCGASVWSLSTADTEAMMAETECRQKQIPAVWLEVNLDNEVSRRQEHAKWFGRVMQQPSPDAKETSGLNNCSMEVARAKTIADLERTAAMYRELAHLHPNLHPILGYGVEGKSFAVVQDAALGCHGLRALPFTPQRCHRVLGQVLSALARLHEQQLPHGHLSPESLVVSNDPMNPQVRIAWTPGQRRTEGHTGATVGFRAPEAEPCTAGDIWAFASIVLVWWTGFATAPHPWTQFARSNRPQQCIQEALATVPPALPQALLDLHAAAAAAEEPEQTFLSLLANLLTRCFQWQASERPSAARLLEHRFFEQAL